MWENEDIFQGISMIGKFFSFFGYIFAEFGSLQGNYKRTWQTKVQIFEPYKNIDVMARWRNISGRMEFIWFLKLHSSVFYDLNCHKIEHGVRSFELKLIEKWYEIWSSSLKSYYLWVFEVLLVLALQNSTFCVFLEEISLKRKKIPLKGKKFLNKE